MKLASYSATGSVKSLGLILLLVLSALCLNLAGQNEQYPLSDAHWDSSIYLLAGKKYEQGHYLTEFRERAAEIHDAVMRGVFPTDYWSFARLGHIAIIGTITQITGTDEKSIYIVAWVYRILLVIGVVFSALTALELLQMLAPGSFQTMRHYGILVSMALYMLSGIGRYMSGNLVSEVPAIMLLSISAWALVMAWKKQSLLYAGVSGLFAFMLYAVRMESLWTYLAFLVPAVWFITNNHADKKIWWQGIAMAGMGAALPFLVYSWVFFPLTDPRLFLEFSKASAVFFAKQAEPNHVDAIIGVGKRIIVAGGLLWVGAALALFMARSSRLFRFGSAWLVLSLVPAGIAVAESQITQVRMFTTIMPALLILSTLGWSTLLSMLGQERAKLKVVIAIAVCVILLAVSQPVSYSLLKSLPGMWRLQYVQTFLAPPAYERVDYHLPELFSVRHFLDSFEQPAIVLASPEMQVADHIMIIQYLDQAPANSGLKTEKSQEQEFNNQSPEIHLSGTAIEDEQLIRSLPETTTILLLGTSESHEWFSRFACCGDIKVLFSTKHYMLAKIVPG